MLFFHRPKLHSSWVIALTSGGVVVALAATAWMEFQPTYLVWLGVGVAIAFGLLFTRVVVMGALLLGCMIGGYRGMVLKQEIAGYNRFFGQVQRVEGRVTEDVTKGNSGETHLRLGEVTIAGTHLPGDVWVSASYRGELKRSDYIVIEGKLRSGFGSFPASMSFAKIIRAERPAQGDIARELRDTFADGVRKGIAEPAASLGIGFLVGQKSTLPSDLEDQLKIAGLTHIVVASGYNLTILVRFTRRWLFRISKYTSTIAAVCLIGAFMLVTGFSPSMSRAGFVALLSLAAWYYGRTIHPLVLLPLAAAVTGLLNPLFVWGDLGWYLSFASFVGVMILAPLLHVYFWGREPPGLLRDLMVSTIAAQCMTMPIIAYSFGTAAPYALLANILVVPLIPYIMLLTFCTGIAGLWVGEAVRLLGAITGMPLQWVIAVTQWVADLPGASAEIDYGVGPLLITYTVLLVGMEWLRRATAFDFRQTRE